MLNLWTPETALRRAEHTFIGGHHIAVRQSDVSTVSDATMAAVDAARSNGKPMPNRTPQVMGVWPGALWTYPEDMSQLWATLYLLQATRMNNLPVGAISAFDKDQERLSRKQRRGILPTLVVTETSHTLRWENYGKNVVDGTFYDPFGPETVQRLALERGITVLRTSHEDLAVSVGAVLIDLHLGKTPPQLIIP